MPKSAPWSSLRMAATPFVPDYIRTLVPYVPGKPIEETQRELGIKKVVKLASNENPLGPSPRAIAKAKKCLSSQHRYPDGAAFGLKTTLAKMIGVELSQIIVGNGSNEIIEFIIRAFCVPGDEIVTHQAAFIAYKISAQIQGVTTFEAGINETLHPDLDGILARVRSNPKAKLVFLANPNNPTGAYLNSTELRGFLRELAKIRDGSVLAVLDYAYWEYVTSRDLPDPTVLMREFPSVVVLRTFSKVYGLAGMRVGYAYGDREIVQTLEKVRQPFNLNDIGMRAADAALSDRAFVSRAVRANAIGMEQWRKALTEFGVKFWPSQGNFILVDAQASVGLPGGEVFTRLLRRGVILRPVTNYGLWNAIRISVGTREENAFAIRAWKEEFNRTPIQAGGPKPRAKAKKSKSKSKLKKFTKARKK